MPPFASIPLTAQHRALWWSLVALIVLAFVITVAGRGTHVDIKEFELAGTPAAASALLDQWGLAGRRYLRLSLWLDFPFIVAYAVFLALACAGVARAVPTAVGFRAAGEVLSWLVVVAGLLDCVENLALFQVLGVNGSTQAPAVAAGCAKVKFAIVGCAVAYVLLGGIYATQRRERSAQLS